MSETVTIELADAAATERLGARLAPLLDPGAVVYLQGDLGAGKTTLVRGLLHALGHQGTVRSPTYTLVEPYPFASHTVYHLDLYRLGDPEELEYLGLRDFIADRGVLLIEWPERGRGWLPPADLCVRLDHLPQGRRCRLRGSQAVQRSFGGPLLPCNKET